MATKVKHTYLGVVLATQKRETIEANSTDAAKREMRKLHGDEFTKVEGKPTVTNWVVGRQPGD